MLSRWVRSGGALIAMRPDTQLAGLLGLTPSGSRSPTPTSGRHLQGRPARASSRRRCSSTAPPTATRSTAPRASPTLYADATTATRQPGGDPAHASARAAARPPPSPTTWPARSSTRGRAIPPGPARSATASGPSARTTCSSAPSRRPAARLGRPGQGRDPAGRRAAAAAGQPDRATERATSKPLPRFWYLPRGQKAVVVMTGDDHGQRRHARAASTQYIAASPAGCVGRPTGSASAARSYIYPDTPAHRRPGRRVPRRRASRSRCMSTRAAPTARRPRCERLRRQLAAFGRQLRRAFPPPPPTARTASPGATGRRSRRSSSTHGIRLDTQLLLLARRAGCRTGPGCSPAPGMPMRFADLDGTLIDVYQAATQMTDESGQTLPVHDQHAARPRARARGLLRRLHREHAHGPRATRAGPTRSSPRRRPAACPSSPPARC